MIRLLGAITGSALALATLLVLIGIPQFKATNSAIDRAVVTLPLPTSPVDAKQVEAPAVPSQGVDAPIAATAEADSTETPIDASGQEDDATEPAALPLIEAPAAIPESVIEESEQWYAFWSPFRSELAAAGFVDQLSRVTGLDYRVVKVKTGVYEVAFAYRDDADIVDSLSQITAATGLDMPGAK